MPDHYYTQSPQSAHNERTVSVSALGNTILCTTDAGTFSRDGLDFGTRALIDALPPLFGNVLDLGCGWGAMGLILAAKYPQAQFSLTDINERAAALAEKNRLDNAIANARVLTGDGFSNISGKFDFILTNPPIRAGKSVIYALFKDAFRFLAPGGKFYLVIRKQQGAKSAIAYLETVFPSVAMVEKSGGFWVIKAQTAQ